MTVDGDDYGFIGLFINIAREIMTENEYDDGNECIQ